VANRGDGTGNYLFGGQGTAQPPFVESGTGAVVYQGTPGDTLVASNESLGTTLDGGHTWLQAPGNAPGVTVSLFDVLDTAIAQLSTTGATNDQVAAAVKTGVGDLDTFHAHLLSVRARTGEALNRMDQVEMRIADGKLAAQVERSSAEDLDMVQAISDFQNRQTGYDAALRAYSMVQKLSLFNYISG
jgi:flagellar hook-associated protein 3 FlgL